LSATSSRVCIWIMGRTPLLCTGPRLGGRWPELFSISKVRKQN